MVVDHGSTDGTLTVARQFESNEVRVVTQPNQGAAAPRVPSGDTAKSDELKDAPGKIRTPGRVGGAILRAESTPPSLAKRQMRDKPVISVLNIERTDLMRTIGA
jgi:hypothetical protein